MHMRCGSVKNGESGQLNSVRGAAVPGTCWQALKQRSAEALRA